MSRKVWYDSSMVSKKRKSKYDKIIKLPMSFDQAMGILVKPVPKKRKKR